MIQWFYLPACIHIHYEYEAVLEGYQSALHKNHLFLYVNSMNKNLPWFLWAFIFWWKLKIVHGNPLNIRYHFQFIAATPVWCLIFSYTNACPENLILFLLMMQNFSGVRSVQCSQLQPPQEAAVSGSLLFLFFLLLIKEPSWYRTFVGVPYTTLFCIKSTASFTFLESHSVSLSLPPSPDGL